jgi:hypothetical protein
VTPFQWLTLAGLGGLLALEVSWFVRGRVVRGPWVVRCLTWLAAALAIAFPDTTQWLATAVGITRGSDLVMYLVALAFLGTTFYFYSRQVRLQRQLVEVVRHVAIREAVQGGGRASPPGQEGQALPDQAEAGRLV